MNKRNFITTGASMAALALLSTTGCTTSGGSSGDPAAQRASIDAAVDSALTRLYPQAIGSRELVASARGVLVIPSFVSAGFIVGGGSGQGALRVAGKTASYHRMTEGSVGLQAGAQSQAVFILFMTEEALNRFRSSNGWTIGADASVALITVGADARITSQTGQQPVIGFVLTNSGIMGSLSLSGSRVTTLDIK